MHLETAHFDSVFGVSRTSQNRRLATLFNFTASGHTEYSVAAPGAPRLVPGMTVTALLEEKDNWQTLIGWRDHESGDIVCDRPTEEILLCVALPPVIALLAATAAKQPMSFVALVLVSAYLAWAIRRIRILRRARAMLAALPLPAPTGK